MNLTYDLEALIYATYGTREKLAKDLGVSRGSVQRWLSQDPRKFLQYAPEFERKGVEPKRLSDAVARKLQDYEHVV